MCASVSLAWLSASAVADSTSKPYELLFIWEAFKLGNAVSGSSNCGILKDWQAGSYGFDGFVTHICKQTNHTAGTVTNTDDLDGSIKQWRAKGSSCSYITYSKIIDGVARNAAK